MFLTRDENFSLESKLAQFGKFTLCFTVYIVGMNCFTDTPSCSALRTAIQSHALSPGAGADPRFSEGGSESGVDIGVGIVSLKLGVWGARPPEAIAMEHLILFSTKSHM